MKLEGKNRHSPGADRFVAPGVNAKCHLVAPECWSTYPLMSRRAALNISMPPELAAYVATLVASGRYGTASEVVRAGLRLLQEREATLPGPTLDGDVAKMLPETH